MGMTHEASVELERIATSMREDALLLVLVQSTPIDGYSMSFIVKPICLHSLSHPGSFSFCPFQPFSRAVA